MNPRPSVFFPALRVREFSFPSLCWRRDGAADESNSIGTRSLLGSTPPSGGRPGVRFCIRGSARRERRNGQDDSLRFCCRRVRRSESVLAEIGVRRRIRVGVAPLGGRPRRRTASRRPREPSLESCRVGISGSAESSRCRPGAHLDAIRCSLSGDAMSAPTDTQSPPAPDPRSTRSASRSRRRTSTTSADVSLATRLPTRELVSRSLAGRATRDGPGTHAILDERVRLAALRGDG